MGIFSKLKELFASCRTRNDDEWDTVVPVEVGCVWVGCPSYIYECLKEEGLVNPETTWADWVSLLHRFDNTDPPCFSQISTGGDGEFRVAVAYNH